MNEIIRSVIDSITPLDEPALTWARSRQESLAKPPHSLGRLEDLSIQLTGVLGKDANVDKCRVLVFAADNGVVEEGVSSAPKSVTRIQAMNIARGFSGAGVLARCYDAECEVIDVGIDWDEPMAGVRGEKVRRGTANIAVKPAMTREEAERAILMGIDAAKDAKETDVGMIGIGEMGIGNTTTSSAVLSVLLDLPAQLTVGRGGGLDDDGFRRKIEIIDHAIASFEPDPSDPIDVLCKVGGLDLCAMTGAFLGAAAMNLPAVIDGYISSVAALCAYRLAPMAIKTMIPSHASREGGYALAMDVLGLRPLFDLDMRLGEGSGCPIAFSMARASLAILHEMATFDELSIDDSYLTDIRADRRLLGEA